MKIKGLEFRPTADGGVPYENAQNCEPNLRMLLLSLKYAAQKDEFYRVEDKRMLVYTPAGCGESKPKNPTMTVLRYEDDSYRVCELNENGVWEIIKDY